MPSCIAFGMVQEVQLTESVSRVQIQQLLWYVDSELRSVRNRDFLLFVALDNQRQLHPRMNCDWSYNCFTARGNMRQVFRGVLLWMDEIRFAPRNETMVETIVCWYLQGNRTIPGFLRSGFCPSIYA